MSLLGGLAAHLAAQSIGVYRADGSAYTTDEAGIFLEYLPETGDTAITLTTYEGAASDSKLGMDTPRVQARVRGLDQTAARTLCQAVYNELHGLGPITLTDTPPTRLLLCVGLSAGPYYLGRDESQRHVYVTNLQADIVNVSTHRV